MEKIIYDEKNSLWYELQGDYYIPCLKLPEEEQQPVGLWGQRHLRYIKQHRKESDSFALGTGCAYLHKSFRPDESNAGRTVLLSLLTLLPFSLTSPSLLTLAALF